uniref:Uncharacterized protein n=1 Tax=Anguilla anguilla TaxID=7936 RepID=A0A0E9PBH0_ANGAN
MVSAHSDGMYNSKSHIKEK